VTVNKVNWSQAGQVTAPGRYMFKFGWLTITEAELDEGLSVLDEAVRAVC